MQQKILILYSTLKTVSKCTLHIIRNETLLNSKEKLTITLSKSNIVKNGLFRNNSFKVLMFTEAQGWKVARTYDDFKWLHARLKSRFPANYIVELPQLEVTEESKETDTYLLNSYINHVIHSPDLLYSPELVDFLQLSEKSFLKSKEVENYLKETNIQLF